VDLKQIVDLSVPLKSLDTPIYPIYPQPLRLTFSTVRDNGYASNVWIFADHTSTHVDAPAHFSEGAPTIDMVPIERYVTSGFVLDFSKKPPMYSITRQDITEQLQRGGHGTYSGWALLFNTGYTSRSRSNEWMNYPGLSEDAAKFIAELQVSAIGFDAPAPDHEPSPAHHILLSKSISIYENLCNLEKLVGKDFLFIGVPLKLVGGSASPVRALAIIT
jgi:kynurenine formamidase